MPQFQLFYEEFKEEIQLVGLTSGYSLVWAPTAMPKSCCGSWAWLIRQAGPTAAASPASTVWLPCRNRVHQFRRHDHGEERGRYRRQFPGPGFTGIVGSRGGGWGGTREL